MINLEEYEFVRMSGFWLDKTKFITCAHFLNNIPTTNMEETEKFLNVSNPERPRAFVSSRRLAEGVIENGKCIALRDLPFHPRC